MYLQASLGDATAPTVQQTVQQRLDPIFKLTFGLLGVMTLAAVGGIAYVAYTSRPRRKK